jgi:mono/diheme cytochrome c family protein
MTARALAALLAATAILAACEEKRFDPPDREARVAHADSLYSPALFDTVTWTSQQERHFTGNDVYAAHCRRCHGPMGEGDTPYARERGLDVPSLVEPDWEYAADVDAVRRRIFTGHPAGMPTWGVAGIPPREIDAVAAYILEQLRPDALGAGPAPAQP